MFPRQPIKLDDCVEHGLDTRSELFIVEGDSAAQSVSRVKNPDLQAVLPMQGKPLNAWKAREKTVRANPFFRALIDSIGTDIGELFQIQGCRYGRIILLYDPDADGIHCGTLTLLFFYRWMRPLLEANRIAIVRPPMMRIVADQTEFTSLAFSEEDGQVQCDQLLARGMTGVTRQRFRGLASLNADLLKTSCIEPATRRCFLLTSRDAEDSAKFLKWVAHGNPNEPSS